MKVLFLIILTAFAISSCDEICTDGSGNLKEKVIQNLPDYTGVDHPYSGEVFLTKGEPGVVLVSDDNVLDLFVFDVKNGILDIKDKENHCFSASSIYMRLISHKFEYIEANGSADWTSDPLDNDLNILSNGSGDMNLVGESDEQVIVLNGSGDVILENMPTVKATIIVNGSGDCKVRASGDVTVESNGSGHTFLKDAAGKLIITINGSGNVYYSGTPIELVTTIHGSGRVIKQ